MFYSSRAQRRESDLYNVHACHLLRTHLQDQHEYNLKIAYFELLKKCPPPMP